MLFSLIVIGGVLGVSVHESVKFEKQHQEAWERVLAESTTQPLPTVAPRATPVAKPAVVASNTEPKIDCLGPDGKVAQMTRKECEDLSRAWGKNPVILNDVKAPTPAPVQANNSNNYNASTYSYTPTRYYPCTICGSYTGCQTYNYLYETKEQCDAAQASMNSIGAPTPQPTISPEQAQSAYDAYQKQVQQCKSQVHSYYNQQVQNCQIQYGASSAAVACEQIMNGERNSALAACE